MCQQEGRIRDPTHVQRRLQLIRIGGHPELQAVDPHIVEVHPGNIDGHLQVPLSAVERALDRAYVKPVELRKLSWSTA